MKEITSKTKILGVFGYPIEHSLSPPMHNAAIEYLRLDYCYLPFEVKPKVLGEAIRGIVGLGIKGINVTIPHKEKVMAFLDEIAEEAQILGAVNTIDNREGKLMGYNTDGQGFVNSVKEIGEKVEGKKVMIIGAGGACRALAVALAKEKAKSLLIVNRTPQKGEKIAQVVNEKVKPGFAFALPLEEDEIKKRIGEIDILINATPVGMYPSSDVPPIISPRILHKDLLVCDLIYNPPETVLLREAKSIGCKTLNGVGMLVHQGAISFEIWTGIKPPVEVMRKAIIKRLTPAKV